VTETTKIELPSLGMSLYGMMGGGIAPGTEGYWASAAEGTLSMPTCENCGTQRWPMELVCYACHSTDWSWNTVPGTGTVFTYTWIDSPTHPGTAGDNVVVVELDGTAGADAVRVPGWVVDVEQGGLACGQPVVVDFEIVADGIGVPYWRLADR
jgi:uncharacterized protein